LEIEVSEALRLSRQLVQLRATAKGINAELSQFPSIEADSLRTDIGQAASTMPSATLTSLIDRAEVLLQSKRAAHAAKARREVILSGLAELGYTIFEDLATAWVSQGKVVLRNAAQPEYGVELQGDLKGSQIQVRTVAFSQPGAMRDTSQDKNAEAVWCDGLGKLRRKLADNGDEITIEKALGIGEVPLKLVDEPVGANESQATDRPNTQFRSR
jgi:hypothetical protein